MSIRCYLSKAPHRRYDILWTELSDIIFNPVTAVMTGYTAYTEATDADVGNTLITASYPAGDSYFLPGTGNKIVNVIACPTTTTTPSAAVWAVNFAGTISASVVAQTPGQGLINEGYIFFWTDSLSSSGVSGIIPLGYGAVQSGGCFK